MFSVVFEDGASMNTMAISVKAARDYAVKRLPGRPIKSIKPMHGVVKRARF